jgi:hypothetical protein
MGVIDDFRQRVLEYIETERATCRRRPGCKQT